MPKKILFIAAHRTARSPSQRFRFEQYLDYLQQNGFKYKLSNLISEKQDRIFYKPGNFFLKIAIVINGFLKRCIDVWTVSNYHIVFVQREAFMTGLTFFEKRFSKSKAKFIFDFDDSIWLLDTSKANKNYEWLKSTDKTGKLISLAHLVFAGNPYLANYALQFNKNVKIIPTTIDTNQYKRSSIVKKDDTVCIGWTGSITTIKHFEYAIPFLRKIKQHYGNKVLIKVIGDESYVSEELDVKGIPWNSENEIKELSAFDIGIMPLPNDEWSKGKCGLKGLQYMALEIPAVMSPVGVNTEIINDGINGFLADSEDDWIKKIAQLIEDKNFREKMGKEARKTVVQKYSVESQKENYLNYFNDLLKQ